MNYFYYTVLFATLACAGANWSDVAPLPEVLSDQACAVHGFRILTFGGCNGEQDCNLEDFCICTKITDDVNIYDSRKDTWSQGTKMPRSRYRMVSEIVDGKAYVIGGRALDDQLVTAVDIYNIKTDTWETGAALEANVVMSDMGAFVIGTDIYVAGGYDQDYNALAATHMLDTKTGVWTYNVANMNDGRGDVCGLTVDGRGWIAGGFNHNDFCTPLFELESYADDESKWEKEHTTMHADETDDPTKNGDKACLTIGRNIYALGGEIKTPECLTEVIAHSEVYNVDQDRWYHRPEFDLPHPRFRFCAAAVGKQMYVIGGQNNLDNATNKHPILSSVITADSSPAAVAAPMLLLSLLAPLLTRLV